MFARSLDRVTYFNWLHLCRCCLFYFFPIRCNAKVSEFSSHLSSRLFSLLIFICLIVKCRKVTQVARSKNLWTWLSCISISEATKVRKEKKKTKKKRNKLWVKKILIKADITTVELTQFSAFFITLHDTRHSLETHLNLYLPPLYRHTRTHTCKPLCQGSKHFSRVFFSATRTLLLLRFRWRRSSLFLILGWRVIICVQCTNGNKNLFVNWL